MAPPFILASGIHQHLFFSDVLFSSIWNSTLVPLNYEALIDSWKMWNKGTGAPAGFRNVDAQPVGSGASLREMIRNIDNYFAIGWFWTVRKVSITIICVMYYINDSITTITTIFSRKPRQCGDVQWRQKLSIQHWRCMCSKFTGRTCVPCVRLRAPL